MTKTVRKNRTWTDEDKKFLISTAISYVKQGKTLQDSFNYTAKKLGVSPITVKYYWYMRLKDTCLEEFEEAREYAKKKLINQIALQSQYEGNEKTMSQVASSSAKGYVTGKLFTKKSSKLNSDHKLDDKDENIVKMTPLKQTKSEESMTKLQMMVNLIKTMEEEDLIVINSGKGGIDFIVINNEQDFGYVINTQDNKVTKCNCSHHLHRDVICKHMLKVALEKNLEIF